MTCPNCQTVNPSGAKFCFNCGHAMPQACANCGTPMGPGAKFCNNCGQAAGAPVSQTPVAPAEVPVPATPAPPPPQQAPGKRSFRRRKLPSRSTYRATCSASFKRRGEPAIWAEVSRHHTLLHSKALPPWRSNGPGRVADIIDQAFDYLISPRFTEYEGALARLMGDAILAFFGAPLLTRTTLSARSWPGSRSWKG